MIPMTATTPSSVSAVGPSAQVAQTRRSFLGQSLAASLAVATDAAPTAFAAAATPAKGTSRQLRVALQDATGLELAGPHRFHPVKGRTGFHGTSLKTRAQLATDLHRAPNGTLALWFSPLEDLTFSPANAAESKVRFDFPFVSDLPPARSPTEARFAVSFATGYPAIIGRFTNGAVFSKLDFGLAPFVYAEKAILRQGYWYHLAMTWERPAKRLVIYLNGMMAGHNEQAENFDEAGPALFVGNPMMVLRELLLEDRALSVEEIRAAYQAARPAENDRIDAEFRAMLEPRFLPPLDLRRDAAWRLVYECAFTRESDLREWTRQGPSAQYLDRFRLQTTAEGLYVKTPDEVEKETRTYLWSNRRFEGDQWLEFDFRLESPKGLALVGLCVSGMQREDFIEDHGVPETGSMITILRDVRCYHWEFFRRVEAMRADVETQYVAKNPFGHRLHSACIPRLEQNRWYRLRLIKNGPRLHGAIDGRTVFDLIDDPFRNNGPVYNYGRIVLRQMYNTALRYRNLTMHVKAAVGDA